MKKIAFIVDSSSGIVAGQYEDIYVLPLSITIKDSENTSKIMVLKDGIDINEQQLSAYFAEPKRYEVQTSQASLGEISQIVESVIDQYEQVFAFPIHAKLSGSYSSWKIIEEDYPTLSVFKVLDIAKSLEWSIVKLLEKAKSGNLTKESTQEYLTNISSKRFAFLSVYSMRQLVKGGRVNNAKSIIIGLLSLKLVLSISRDGLNFYNSARTLEKSIDIGLKSFDDRNEGFDIKKIKRVAFLYPPAREKYPEVEEAFEYFKTYLSPNSNIKFEQKTLTPIICAHTGDKAFALQIEVE